MVGEPGFDPDLTDAYCKLTDELTLRVAEIAVQEGRHRAI
jgi:hypothetical protein